MARQDLRLSRWRRRLFFLVILLREQGLAYLFGAGNFADTYNLAAWTAQTSAAALSSAPENLARRKSPWRVPILFGIALTGILLVPYVAGFYASAYHRFPVKLELVVQTTQILFLVLPILVLGGLTNFLFQAVAMVSGLVLAGLVLPVMPDSGFRPIVGMALGWVLGAIVYSTGFMKNGFANAPENSALAPAAIPIALGISVILGSSSLAGQGTGAVSWLSYAAHLVLVVGGLFWAFCMEGNGGSEDLNRDLRKLLTVLLPICVGLIFFRLPVVQVLFQRGRFYAEDALATSRVLAIDSVTLMGVVFLRMTLPNLGEKAKGLALSPWLAVGLSTLLSAALASRFGFWALAIGPAAVAVLQSMAVAARIPGSWRAFRLFFIQLTLCIAVGLVCRFSFDRIERMLPGTGFGFRLLGLGLIFVEGFAILAFARRRPGLR